MQLRRVLCSATAHRVDCTLPFPHGSARACRASFWSAPLPAPRASPPFVGHFHGHDGDGRHRFADRLQVARWGRHTAISIPWVPTDTCVPERAAYTRDAGIHLKRDTVWSQPVRVIAWFRFRGRGKSSICDNTVSKRSGNPRRNNRAAGGVPSAARPSKFCRTVHTV